MLLPIFSAGFKNYILGNSIVMLLNPDSKPARRIISDAKSNNKYIDLTKGKAGKCLILLNTNEVAMSNKSVKTIKNKYLKYINTVNQKKGQIILEPFLEIGFNNYILPYNVTSILYSNTIPVKKIIKNAKLTNTLIDCTQGKKTRSILTLFNGMVITSSKDATTIEKTYMKYVNNIYEVLDEDDEEEEEEENLEVQTEEIDDNIEIHTFNLDNGDNYNVE